MKETEWSTEIGENNRIGKTRDLFKKIRDTKEILHAKMAEFCQKNTLVMANTLFQQQKRRLYTWTSPDGQHGNQIDYILCSQR